MDFIRNLLNGIWENRKVFWRNKNAIGLAVIILLLLIYAFPVTWVYLNYFGKENESIYPSNLFDLKAGTIVAYAGSVRVQAIDPKQKEPIEPEDAKGWLLCDGKELPKGQFTKLKKVLRNQWGIGPSGEPMLPDFRGLFLRGVDYSKNSDPDVDVRAHKYQQYCDEVGTYQGDDLLAHAHPIYIKGENPGKGLNIDLALANTPSYDIVTNQLIIPNSIESHVETRPKNIYVNWLIKY